MSIRYKIPLILSYVNPFITLIFPLIIMGQLFAVQNSYGPWNAQNYIIYLFIGYNILLFQRIISDIPQRFRAEKVMLTLQALMIAPFNRFNLLMGYILSHLIEITIPFIIFITVCYVLFPISIITLLCVIGLFLMILIIFSGFGLIVGVFVISNENYSKPITISLNFVFMFSCISYPYQVFPSYIQYFVSLNPVYYLIDIIRLTWIEDFVIGTLISHPIHWLNFFLSLIIFPSIGILMFNYIFKKYGITGY